MLWWGLCALLVVSLAQLQSAAADERLEHYDIEVTIPPEGREAHYRIRFQYRASPHKRDGFKFFGWDRPKNVTVRNDAGRDLKHKQPVHQYEPERIEWKVGQPDDSGLQTVWVEFDQPLAVTHGWRTHIGHIPWADEFGLPVDHMSVTSHVPGVINDPNCSYDGHLSHCTMAKGQLFEVNSIKLQRSSMGSSFLLLLALLGVSLGLLVARYSMVRRALVRERGVLPPAPARLAFAGPFAGPKSYRAPPELPVAAEPQLSESDAGVLRQRLHVVLATLLPVVLLAFVLDGRSLLPMPTVVGLGLIIWIGCGLYMLGRGLSWQTVALPLAMHAWLAAVAFIGIGYREIMYKIIALPACMTIYGIYWGVRLLQHKGWLPEGTVSGGSGCSGCSSCGGGGCGGGCGGGGCGG